MKVSEDCKSQSLEETNNYVVPATRRPKLRDVLMVSFCNAVGGLALVGRESTFILDNHSTTGLATGGERIIRSLQFPEQLEIRRPGHEPDRLVVPGLSDCHDVLVVGDATYAVSTGTNQVFALDETGKEIKRWTFPGAPDAWHLNCLDVWDGKVVVSAFGMFEEGHWRQSNWDEGVVFELESQKVLWNGLCQPHNPRMADGRRFVTNSGEHTLLVDTGDGAIHSIEFDGFVRGLEFGAEFIYVGVSRSREFSLLKCAHRFARIVILDRKTLRKVGEVELPAYEIYDIRILDKTYQRLLLPDGVESVESLLPGNWLCSRFANQELAPQIIDQALSLVGKQREEKLGLERWLCKALSGRMYKASRSSEPVQIAYEVIQGSGLFDETYYLNTVPEVAKKGIDALRHYITIGGFEGGNPNPFFDSRFYLQQNEDVHKSGINPLLHFILIGATMQLDPAPSFSIEDYLYNYPDVKASGLNPLKHYLTIGKKEGRMISKSYSLY